MGPAAPVTSLLARTKPGPAMSHPSDPSTRGSFLLSRVAASSYASAWCTGVCAHIMGCRRRQDTVLLQVNAHTRGRCQKIPSCSMQLVHTSQSYHPNHDTPALIAQRSPAK